jgi:hypothetical protein
MSAPRTPPHSKPQRWWNLPRRALLGLLTTLVALLILFEEWGWEPLQRVLARLGQLPGLRWLEQRIQALPPYAALALFLLPTLALLPVKLLALWFIGQGRVLMGTLVLVGAKIVGTAIVARLFALTQPVLMQLAWFATLYDRWHGWKERLLARVRRARVWRQARWFMRRLRRQWLR